MNSKTKGILCIVTAAFCFAFMSLCVRLAGDLPSMQKILFRNLLAFFIVGAGLVRKPEKLEIHKGDLSGTEKARCQKAEGRVLQRTADQTN